MGKDIHTEETDPAVMTDHHTDHINSHADPAQDHPDLATSVGHEAGTDHQLYHEKEVGVLTDLLATEDLIVEIHLHIDVEILAVKTLQEEKSEMAEMSTRRRIKSRMMLIKKLRKLRSLLR